MTETHQHQHLRFGFAFSARRASRQKPCRFQAQHLSESLLVLNKIGL